MLIRPLFYTLHWFKWSYFWCFQNNWYKEFHVYIKQCTRYLFHSLTILKKEKSSIANITRLGAFEESQSSVSHVVDYNGKIASIKVWIAVPSTLFYGSGSKRLLSCCSLKKCCIERDLRYSVMAATNACFESKINHGHSNEVDCQWRYLKNWRILYEFTWFDVIYFQWGYIVNNSTVFNTLNRMYLVYSKLRTNPFC